MKRIFIILNPIQYNFSSWRIWSSSCAKERVQTPRKIHSNGKTSRRILATLWNQLSKTRQADQRLEVLADYVNDSWAHFWINRCAIWQTEKSNSLRNAFKSSQSKQRESRIHRSSKGNLRRFEHSTRINLHLIRSAKNHIKGAKNNSNLFLFKTRIWNWK